MAHYGPEQWWYSSGSTAASVRAAVFEGDQSTLASIFSDSGLSVPLANPTTTNASGFLEFYAADGDYWIFVGDETYGDSVLSTLGPAATGAVVSVNGQSGVVVLNAANVGAQPIATINAKGDLYAGTGNDATTRRSIGTDGQVLTADSGDPTGMSWQAGGGGGSVASVNGQTGVVVLTASNVGAAPTTRILTAGIALSGGGDLTADRTFDVDLGTTAGTAAAGDDTRIVGSQQRSILSTKGDLYAATAAATVTRQAVGSDGQVLTADSAQSTGLKWSTPASAPVTSVNGQTGVVVLTATNVGAIAATLPDAKGDIITATAADTPARLAVGTNGQALRANSATATGLEWDTLDAADVGADPIGAAAAAQAASQPVDSDLTAIAALIPTNDDIIQRKAGAWTNRSVAQYKVDLAYTPADIGAVPTSRNLTAGIGISGGGDLSADRTFDVDYGTTAGTATEGNDTRVTGAQQRSALTAKGDLYVATASATVTRRAVGTDGQVLTADSAQVDGIKWAAPGSAPVTSVNGQTGVVVLTSSDVGAQPIATIDAKGDLYAGTGDNATSRQAVGTDTQVLRANSVNSTGLEWHTLVSSDVGAQPLDSDLTTIAGLTPTNDDVMQYKAGAWANRTITQVKTDLAYTAAQVGAVANTLVDAKGDLVTATANDTPARLAVGTDGQYLRAASGQTTGLEYHTIVASDVGAVPTTRILTASTGLTGGGDLSADRSFAVAYGTSASTATEGNDTRVTGAQQRSTLTTKGDLYVATASATTTRRAVGTDGQVLTADSAQTDGIKWAAASDSGAVQKSTVTTKGDLIAATGSATVSRLAAGSNGQVLSANSAQSTGLEWIAAPVDAGAQQRSTLTTKGDLYVATASATTARQAVGTDGFALISDSTLTNGLGWKIRASVGIYPRSTGYSPAAAIGTARSSKTSTQDVMFLSPFYLLIGATLSSIAFEVSGAIALAVVRLGIYGSDSSMLPTGAALADYGTVLAATTGTKTAAVSTLLAPGLYWVASVGQTVAPTLRFSAGQSPWVPNATFPAGSGAGWNNAFAQTGVSGALPSIGTLTDSDAPLLGLKF